MADSSPSRRHRLGRDARPSLSLPDEVRAGNERFIDHDRFFSLFDSYRDQLQDVYAAQATFSIVVNATKPDRGKAKGVSETTPGGGKPTWTEWLKESRNLKRLMSKSMGDKRVKYLHVGPQSIVPALKSLPGTAHPLNEADKFIVDQWVVPSLVDGTMDAIMVSVHGELLESAFGRSAQLTSAEPSDGKRSFDRNFILVAPPPGSPCVSQYWCGLTHAEQSPAGGPA